MSKNTHLKSSTWKAKISTIYRKCNKVTWDDCFHWPPLVVSWVVHLISWGGSKKGHLFFDFSYLGYNYGDFRHFWSISKSPPLILTDSRSNRLNKDFPYVTVRYILLKQNIWADLFFITEKLDKCVFSALSWVLRRALRCGAPALLRLLRLAYFDDLNRPYWISRKRWNLISFYV